ncbi:MAG: GAF domain-containing protein [Synechococcaceae cyanobacterium RL_1_2]|nr:GAF domain-containing protein [Synechococcaceae cyanobacterium RL_1_2]
MRQTDSLLDLCEKTVQEVKKITDFDRVLVYRFGFEGAGEVIAEEVSSGYDQYLGLHYPYLDIPPQARTFYKKIGYV